MTNLKLTLARSHDDLVRFYPVMKELRTNLIFEDFLSIYEQAHRRESYEIVALEKEGQVLALMGYRILHDYVHGRHLYIDDLVTTASHRSQGLGAQLLAYAEQLAKDLECKGLRLCTGFENESGKKFYEREGWNLRAVAYKKKIAGK